ncbi:MAG: hypothetical protein AB1481_05120 [Candidatus Omnitrophota bacterium]
MPQSGFNPKARWDRHIPQKDADHNNPDGLSEKIAVMAFFQQAKLYPRLFIWNNKKYKITKVTYNWQERSGREVISYFSVACGFNLYQISFNNSTFSWRLDKIIQ